MNYETNEERLIEDARVFLDVEALVDDEEEEEEEEEEEDGGTLSDMKVTYDLTGKFKQRDLLSPTKKRTA